MTPPTVNVPTSDSMTDMNPRIQKFLNRVDRVADRLGVGVPPIVCLDELRQLSPGSFGRAWVDSLDRHNLTPFTSGPRRKQLHDGVHLLTGYGTDLMGEAEVQAFLLGAKFRLVNLMLGLGLVRIIHGQLNRQGSLNLQRDEIWNRLWQAYQRGRSSHFDPDLWQPEELWHLPLDEVRTLFGLEG